MAVAIQLSDQLLLVREAHFALRNVPFHRSEIVYEIVPIHIEHRSHRHAHGRVKSERSQKLNVLPGVLAAQSWLRKIAEPQPDNGVPIRGPTRT